MSKMHIKWVRQALDKARPKEIKISWSDYYPICPRCGSWEIERRYRSGKIWSYCPMCGQKLRDVKIKKEEVLPERWKSIIMGKFKRRS